MKLSHKIAGEPGGRARQIDKPTLEEFAWRSLRPWREILFKRFFPTPDLVVGNIVLVELKSLESLSRVHKKQVLTYLRLPHLKLGLLINFGGFSAFPEGLGDDEEKTRCNEE
jgi:hypothetical protein